MLILTVRTDKPDSEIGLYDNHEQLAYVVWQAHRHLAETIHLKINELLERQGRKPQDIQGLVVFKGPGSFTGLRIGLSVANTLAYSYSIPIASETDDWIEKGIEKLLKGHSDKISLPEYGQPAHVTSQKK